MMQELIALILCSQERSRLGGTLVSSVLPTPVGPAKSMAAMGRRGSFRPLRARFMARATVLTASACPITLSCTMTEILSLAGAPTSFI